MNRYGFTFLIVHLFLILSITNCSDKISDPRFDFNFTSEKIINDPAMLLVDVNLVRSIINDDSINFRIEISLHDTTDYQYYPIFIQDGSVKVNGVNLRKEYPPKTYILSTTDGFHVVPDCNYLITIELSDGKIYTASIKTQTNDLYFINVPETHQEEMDLLIEWVVDSQQDRLYLEYWFENGSIITQNLIYYPTGEFTIPQSYWSADSATALHVQMFSINLGNIDQSFYPMSEITSYFYSVEEVINLE